MVGSIGVKCAIGHCMVFMFLLPYASYADGLRETDERTGVQIVCTPEWGMFPEEWLTDPVNAQAFSLHEGEIERSLKIIKSVLRKYPDSVLKTHLERVYVVHNLIFHGVSVGGINSENRIYIVNSGLIRGYTDTRIEETFHHEMAHILLRHFTAKFDETEWEKINPPGFQYLQYKGLDVTTLKGKYLGNVDRRHLRNGFLDEYALLHWKEDFCIFAQKLFVGQAAFWQIVERYERIKKKTAMVIEFYRTVDPTLTEEYFRRFAKETPGDAKRTIYYDA